MKTIKNILLSVFVVTLLTNCSKEDDQKTPRFQLKVSDHLDDLDYLLYSLILEDLFTNSENLVVTQETQTVFPDRTYLRYLEEKYPEIETSVFLDYILKNDTVYYLENKFDVASKDISIVSAEELEYIFRGTEDINKGWEEFFRRFPDSAGEIGFPRIGYNTDKTQAMVEMSNMYASLGGEGFLIFLELENNVWKIVKAIPTWIS